MHRIYSCSSLLYQWLSKTCASCAPSTINCLPIKHQLGVCTANFLHRFIASENIVCWAFSLHATFQLRDLFAAYGEGIRSARQLANALYELNCLTLLYFIQWPTDRVYSDYTYTAPYSMGNYTYTGPYTYSCPLNTDNLKIKYIG